MRRGRIYSLPCPSEITLANLHSFPEARLSAHRTSLGQMPPASSARCGLKFRAKDRPRRYEINAKFYLFERKFKLFKFKISSTHGGRSTKVAHGFRKILHRCAHITAATLKSMLRLSVFSPDHEYLAAICLCPKICTISSKLKILPCESKPTFSMRPSRLEARSCKCP